MHNIIHQNCWFYQYPFCVSTALKVKLKYKIHSKISQCSKSRLDIHIHFCLFFVRFVMKLVYHKLLSNCNLGILANRRTYIVSYSENGFLQHKLRVSESVIRRQAVCLCLHAYATPFFFKYISTYFCTCGYRASFKSLICSNFKSTVHPWGNAPL